MKTLDVHKLTAGGKLYVSSVVSFPLSFPLVLSFRPTTNTYSNNWWYSGSESSSIERGYGEENEGGQAVMGGKWVEGVRE